MPPSSTPSSSCRRTHALFRQRRKERAIESKPKKMKKTTDRPSSFSSSSGSVSSSSSSSSFAAAREEVELVLDGATTSAAATSCSSSTFASRVPDRSLIPMSEKLRIAKQKMGIDPNEDFDPEAAAKAKAMRRKAWIERERKRQRAFLEKLENEIRPTIEYIFVVCNEFLQLIGGKPNSLTQLLGLSLR